VQKLLVLVLAAGLLAVAAAPAQARSCRPVRNVFDGTRFEGSDLYRIRATGVSCQTARRVAYRATYKAIGLPVRAPIKRFTSHGWDVTDDLRGDADRLSARRGARRVTWLFGHL
jgi:hypothetical protein